MSLKYNWLNVPESINPRYIISAFENPVNSSTVDEYTEVMMNEYDTEYTFPPIMWYPSIITEDTIDEYYEFINWNEILRSDIWKVAWFVTDWHHRSMAANNAWKRYIDVELDRSTITDEKELEDFDNFYNI